MDNSLISRYYEIFKSAQKMAADLHKGDVRGDISRLWRIFTAERGQGLVDYFNDPALRRAYLAYYMPLYAAKIGLLLAQLAEEGQLPSFKSKELSVLDIGAGPLVGILSAYVAFGRVDKATAVDRKVGIMKQGLNFIRNYLPSAEVGKVELLDHMMGKSALKLTKGSFSVAVMAHVLNEMKGPEGLSRRVNWVKEALGYLNEEGRLLIVEPANFTAGVGLMELRDKLESEEGIQILAPCVGARKCPLLSRKHTWCHTDIRWKEPLESKKINQSLGFAKETFLKTSYLLIAKAGAPSKNKAWRIISGKMEEKETTRYYACTSEGRRTLEAKTSSGRQFLQRLDRGDVIYPHTIEGQGIGVKLE